MTAVGTKAEAVEPKSVAIVPEKQEKKAQEVVSNGRTVSTAPQSTETVVSVAKKTLTDADIQCLNTSHKRVEVLDVTGATTNGSLIVSRKAITTLLSSHPQVYLKGIFENRVAEIRKLLSESAQKAFDALLARAKTIFAEKFPGAKFDSAEVQSSKFLAENSIMLASIFVKLCETSVDEIAAIRKSPEVGEKLLQYLNSISLLNEIVAIINDIDNPLFFQRLRAVESLDLLLPILKKYEDTIADYMAALEQDPKCASFHKDITETVRKLRTYQWCLSGVDVVSSIVSVVTFGWITKRNVEGAVLEKLSGLLAEYPEKEVEETVERYKRLFKGIFTRMLILDEVHKPAAASSATSNAEK
jgi:tetratricopeptide (TPR) repeat protein